MVIRGLGIHLPEPRHTAADIAAASGVPETVVRDKLGIAQKPVPGPDDHSNAMGIIAARMALADAGVDAGAIDVLISITDEHKEYPLWTAGIRTAHELGAQRAYAFDVGQKCGSAILALRLASDLIRGGGGDTVLIAGGYRNGDLVDYGNPRTRFLNNLGAAGGAAVVMRDGPGFEILGSAFRTEGDMSYDVLVPVGGTMRPLSPDNLSEYRFDVPDPEGMRARLEHKSMRNFIAVIGEACERSGVAPQDVAYAAVLHMKRSAHRQVLEGVGIPLERSIYLEDYGHLGQIDPLLSLKLAHDQGRLKPGDVAVLCAAGIGYVWNAMCVRLTA